MIYLFGYPPQAGFEPTRQAATITVRHALTIAPPLSRSLLASQVTVQQLFQRDSHFIK